MGGHVGNAAAPLWRHGVVCLDRSRLCSGSLLDSSQDGRRRHKKEECEARKGVPQGAGEGDVAADGLQHEGKVRAAHPEPGEGSAEGAHQRWTGRHEKSQGACCCHRPGDEVIDDFGELFGVDDEPERRASVGRNRRPYREEDHDGGEGAPRVGLERYPSASGSGGLG